MDSNEEDIRDLEKALKTAVDKGILIFCASPDEGSQTDATFRQYYPVGYDEVSSRLFKIGAATAHNRGIAQSARDSQLDFLLPGHEIEAVGENPMRDGKSLLTGSSVATALAAGVAALVIYCVRLAAIQTARADYEAGGPENVAKEAGQAGGGENPFSSRVTLADLKRGKTCEGMGKVLRGISRDNLGQPSDNKFLEVERRFRGPGNELLNNTDGQARMAVIVNLARGFLHEMTR